MSGRPRPFGTGGDSGGGSFEQTDPDYIDKQIPRLASDYRSLDPRWQVTFLTGLSRREQSALLEYLKTHPATVK